MLAYFFIFFQLVKFRRKKYSNIYMDGINFTNSQNADKIIIELTPSLVITDNLENNTNNFSNSVNGTIRNEKNELSRKQKYVCVYCDFSTSKKFDFDRHNNSKKHYNKMNNISKNNDIICDNCGKQYSNRTNLNKHMKKCSVVKEGEKKEKTAVSSELVLEILKQSKDIQNFLVEQTKELHNTLIEQNNKILELSKNQYVVNNTMNNQQFNLNFFLNETCKDAINITDFVKFF